MPYDEGLAERIRDCLGEESEVAEKKMFGGLTFMVAGHMCCGVVGEELMVRVGPEAYDEALARPHAREMDFTKKPLKGFVFVEAEGVAEDDDLCTWVDRGRTFVHSLPPK